MEYSGHYTDPDSHTEPPQVQLATIKVIFFSPILSQPIIIFFMTIPAIYLLLSTIHPTHHNIGCRHSYVWKSRIIHVTHKWILTQISSISKPVVRSQPPFSQLKIELGNSCYMKRKVNFKEWLWSSILVGCLWFQVSCKVTREREGVASVEAPIWVWPTSAYWGL